VQTLGVIARLVLGVVFVVAGASKLASGRAWPAQAAGLGVPRTLARVVPWFELLVGALVLVGAVRPVPVVVASATLVLFTAVLVHSLRRGRRPPCACFGAWSASPIGWGHVARNAAFVAVGAVALFSR
jgi:uncharacterized membrane protein YphA (DoxX/SURF4 family)